MFMKGYRSFSTWKIIIIHFIYLIVYFVCIYEKKNVGFCKKKTRIYLTFKNIVLIIFLNIFLSFCTINKSDLGHHNARVNVSFIKGTNFS